MKGWKGIKIRRKRNDKGEGTFIIRWNRVSYRIGLIQGSTYFKKCHSTSGHGSYKFVIVTELARDDADLKHLMRYLTIGVSFRLYAKYW